MVFNLPYSNLQKKSSCSHYYFIIQVLQPLGQRGVYIINIEYLRLENLFRIFFS